MNDGERIACVTGLLLLGMAATVMFWDMKGSPRGPRGKRRAQEPPVETLADELKEAWGEYHTA